MMTRSRIIASSSAFDHRPASYTALFLPRLRRRVAARRPDGVNRTPPFWERHGVGYVTSMSVKIFPGPTSRFLLCMVLGSLLGLGCEIAEEEAAPIPTAVNAIMALDQLAARFVASDSVSTSEFQVALEPFRSRYLKDWSETELRSATTSLHRLRIALVQRYDVAAPYCADDGLLVFETCDEGTLCVAAAQVTELRCLWYASMPS
jgi:hypothetical protein